MSRGVLFGLTFHDAFELGIWLTALLVGVMALVAFVLVELRVPEPLVPLRLLGHRTFLAAMIADVGLAFFYTTALFLIPLYLELVRGYPVLEVGLWMLPATATVALISPLVGRVVDRVGPLRLLVGGFVAFAASALVQTGLDGASGAPMIVVALVLMGLGWACVLGPAAVAALSAVPSSAAGLAVGAGWTFHNLGGAVGLAVALTVYRAVAGGSIEGVSPAAFTAGYHAAALVLVLGALLTLGAVLVLGRRGIIRGVVVSPPG